MSNGQGPEPDGGAHSFKITSLDAKENPGNIVKESTAVCAFRMGSDRLRPDTKKDSEETVGETKDAANDG